MNVDKSLKEVWDWKDRVYQETKHLSIGKTTKKIHKDVERIIKKYGLKLKTYSLKIKSV